VARKSKYITIEGEKYCPQCRKVKPIQEFAGGYCRDCSRDYHRKYRFQVRLAQIEELVRQAIDTYGICSCGESDPAVLSITPATQSQYGVLVELVASNWPSGYKMVCANCLIKEKARTVRNN
jgi:hypothetical protein